MSDVNSVRIRREVRTLSKGVWNSIVTALWTMKTTSQTKGLELYGVNFRNYDLMVIKHIKAALHPAGDQAHFTAVFPVFHLLWVLEMENALRAIDPTIQAVPYWNCLLNAQAIFTAEYFGSFSGTGTEYAVIDGRFARWPIPFSREVGLDYSNSYGFMRAPLNTNRSPYVTRRGGSMCGYYFGFGDVAAWDSCMTSANTVGDWLTCTDGSIHGRVHMTLGGSWKRDSQKNQEDSVECTQWYGLISNTMGNTAAVDQTQRGSFINAYIADPTCFDCPCCTVDMNPDQCMCQVNTAAKSNGCGPLWTGFAGRGSSFNAKLADTSVIQPVGDLTDPIASAQAVEFLFHHANVDRHFQGWLQRRVGNGGPSSVRSLRQLNYLGYPTSGLGQGSNLGDVMSTDAPFYGLFPNEQQVLGRISSAEAPYTVKEALDLAAFGAGGILYAYDGYAATVSISSVQALAYNESNTLPIDSSSTSTRANMRSVDPIVVVVMIASLVGVIAVGIALCVRWHRLRQSRSKTAATSPAVEPVLRLTTAPATPLWAQAAAGDDPQTDWRIGTSAVQPGRT